MVELMIAQRAQRPHQLGHKAFVPLQHGQRFGGRFQCAQATLHRLRANDIGAGALHQQLDLPHFVQRGRALVHGFGLGPGAVDQHQIVRAR